MYIIVVKRIIMYTPVYSGLIEKDCKEVIGQSTTAGMLVQNWRCKVMLNRSDYFKPSHKPTFWWRQLDRALKLNWDWNKAYLQQKVKIYNFAVNL